MWDNSSLRWAVLVLATVVLTVGFLVWRSQPAPEAAVPQVVRTGQPVPSSAPTPGGASPSPPSGVPSPTGPGAASAAGTPTSVVVVVDVVGPVRRPGVVSLPSGSRVGDAILAAGGLKRGTTAVNLARVLIDGEQIDVSATASAAVDGGGSSPASPGGGPPAAGAGAKVSLNRATIADLENLPRIGPVTAQKIIDFREQNGGFRSVDQLKEVSGIGEVTFAGLSPLVAL